MMQGTLHGIRPGYIHKKETVAFDDTHNEDEWQKEVYDFALMTFKENSMTTVLDIGCGSGYKLRSVFAGKDYTGSEIEPTLSYLKKTYPSDKWCTLT
jgi:SAM-dependent methyltransferase